MKHELKQAWLNILGIEPELTVRLNAKQAINVALEYERLLNKPYETHRIHFKRLLK